MKKEVANIVNHAEVSEKAIERYLCDSVKKLGGICLKYASANATGYPDRLVLLPGGASCWVELKSKGKKATKLQTIRHRELQELGHNVYVVDSKEQVYNLCKVWEAVI